MKTTFLKVAVLAASVLAAPAAYADTYNLNVDYVDIEIDGHTKRGIGYNGASPGPTLRWKEGETVTINVTNNLEVDTSIHWHGIILPSDQDGVPRFSYDGIKPGETFTHNFTLEQSGTYWFHSHSGFQEPDGAYGSIVIEPKKKDSFKYDREYVVQLADDHPHRGATIMRNLKNMPEYYNRSQRDAGTFFDDVGEKGLMATLKDRVEWGNMRMMPTDIEDVQGFTPLINGKSANDNWTGLFKPGERVRLRFINSSAMAFFDIRIPGVEMLVVQADGNNVIPVKVDEFRIAVAETYDVVVKLPDDKAYTIFAESMGRSAFARGTLAPREGMEADVPGMRKPPLLTHADMALDPMMAGMRNDMSDMDHSKMNEEELPPGAHRMPNGTIMGGPSEDPFYANGSGLKPVAAKEGGKFLSYKDLKAFRPLYPLRDATREIELRLTGNMERYFWSINGIKYEDADPIVLNYGERVRFKFINETMMTHPMHLHGMWSIVEAGNGKRNPVKHVVSVAPGTEVLMETEVDAPGTWAFHCHLSYHAASGMFRKVIVKGGPDEKALAPAVEKEV